MAKYTDEDLKGKSTAELRELCELNSITVKERTPAPVLKQLLLSIQEVEESAEETDIENEEPEVLEKPSCEAPAFSEEVSKEVEEERAKDVKSFLHSELRKRRASQNIGSRSSVSSEVARRKALSGNGSASSLQEEIQKRKLNIKR